MTSAATSSQPPNAEAKSESSQNEKHLALLDHGFVELIDAMGSDLTVVNSARVSFGKRKSSLSDGDRKLIKYLAEHQHWSPFRHVQLQFHCKVPEFVARQWYKHVVGIAYSEGGAAAIDHAWNEVSLRYVDASDFNYYVPQGGFRSQSENNKQASTDDLVSDPDNKLINAYRQQCDSALTLYHQLVDSGVAKEQARGLLPLSIYTEFYWTASLQAVVNFIKLRQHPGAQYEIRLYADALEKLARQIVPVSFDALLGSEGPN
ncbi:MAG: FAD-dependent thymidylate synthase [Vampirovibrionales bacterium]|nr:FAD-dependent thymidylate synthase [Vampirovibrionales bacterium]